MLVAEVMKYLTEEHCDKGGMEPKIRAIIDYIENGGKKNVHDEVRRHRSRAGRQADYTDCSLNVSFRHNERR